VRGGSQPTVEPPGSRRGGIDRHLKAVGDAVFEWLSYHEPTAHDPHGIGAKPEGPEPERPEAYDILLQLRRFHLTWAQGGYEDQPWLLTEELNAASDAETRHKNLILLNQKRREEWAASQKAKGLLT